MQIFDHQVTESHLTAKIVDVGRYNYDFGTPKAGDMIGREVTVLHVYPVQDAKFKTDLSYDHAVVKFDDDEKSELLIDVKLRYE